MPRPTPLSGLKAVTFWAVAAVAAKPRTASARLQATQDLVITDCLSRGFGRATITNGGRGLNPSRRGRRVGRALTWTGGGSRMTTIKTRLCFGAAVLAFASSANAADLAGNRAAIARGP